MVWANERDEQSAITGNESRLECAVVFINAIAKVPLIVVVVENKLGIPFGVT